MKTETTEKIISMLKELGWSDEVINNYLLNNADAEVQVAVAAEQK